MKKLFWFVALSLLAGVAQADEYYRSIEGTGKVHYGDKPLPDAADVARLNSLSEPVPDESLPFETRRAQEKSPVTFYIAEGCGDPCKLARKYLNKRGIPYTEKNLVMAEEIDAFKKASGGDQIPAITIGKNWLVRFSESLWSNALDTAGYPQTTPYGFRPSIKSATPAAEKPKSE
jgi:glutaredoxin